MTTQTPSQSAPPVPIRWTQGIGALMAREGRQWFASRGRWLQVLFLIAWFGLIAFALFKVLTPVGEVVDTLRDISQFISSRNLTAAIVAMRNPGAGQAVVLSKSSFVIPFMLAVGALVLSMFVIWAGNSNYLTDRRRGILSWLFTQPITRIGYLLSKVFGDVLGFFVMWVIIPFAIMYMVAVAFAEIHDVPIINYVMALLALTLLAAYWHSLSFMLTVLTNSWRWSLFLPMFLLLFGNLALRAVGAIIPSLGNTLLDVAPWRLKESLDSIVLGTWDASTDLFPLVVVVAWILFDYLIIWLRLRRQQLPE